MLSLFHPVLLLVERTISASGGSGAGGAFDSVNLLVVVALGVGISFLAQWISRRTRRK